MSARLSQAPSSAAMEQFLAYNFEANDDFVQGLQSVLAKSGQSQSDKDQLILQAKLFFFARKTGVHITVQEYEEYTRTHKEASNVAESIQESNTELSFVEIKHLIESGQAHLIPNNKTIPDRLNESSPSASLAKAKRKPWETASDT